MTVWRAGLIAAVFLAAMGLAYLALQPAPLPQDRSSGQALIGGPFTLTDHTGQTVNQESYAGQPTLVYFGFTYCPDICPMGLIAMSQALDRLGPTAKDIQPLFITVDPERDTVATLASYVESFHPRLVGLTGTPEQIAAAAEAYKVYYAKVTPDGASDYLMDHSSIIYLMSADGSYLAHFTHGSDPDQMAIVIANNLGLKRPG